MKTRNMHRDVIKTDPSPSPSPSPSCGRGPCKRPSMAINGHGCNTPELQMVQAFGIPYESLNKRHYSSSLDFLLPGPEKRQYLSRVQVPFSDMVNSSSHGDPEPNWRSATRLRSQEALGISTVSGQNRSRYNRANANYSQDRVSPLIPDDEAHDLQDDDDDQSLASESDEQATKPTPSELLAEKRKMKRFRLSHDQTRLFLNEFARQKHPDATQRERLAHEIPGLSARQVQVWFQNRRAKMKRSVGGERSGASSSRAVKPGFDAAQMLGSQILPAPESDNTAVAPERTTSHFEGQPTISRAGLRPVRRWSECPPHKQTQAGIPDSIDSLMLSKCDLKAASPSSGVVPNPWTPDGRTTATMIGPEWDSTFSSKATFEEFLNNNTPGCLSTSPQSAETSAFPWDTARDVELFTSLGFAQEVHESIRHSHPAWFDRSGAHMHRIIASTDGTTMTDRHFMLPTGEMSVSPSSEGPATHCPPSMTEQVTPQSLISSPLDEFAVHSQLTSHAVPFPPLHAKQCLRAQPATDFSADPLLLTTVDDHIAMVQASHASLDESFSSMGTDWLGPYEAYDTDALENHIKREDSGGFPVDFEGR